MKIKVPRIITGTLIAGIAISALLFFRYLQNQPQDIQLNTVVEPSRPMPDVKSEVTVIQVKKAIVEEKPDTAPPKFVGKEGDLPHPITEDHERLFKENALISDVLGAIDIEDVEALRNFSQQYQDQYPEALVLQQGIDIIADCMESKNETVKYTAQSYYDTERASRLRRYVRRYCLGS